MYLKNSQPSRDLPMPAMPMTETSCARCSSAEAWKSSFTSRSSRSRPTNGGSRPADLQRSAAAGGDPQRAPERDRLVLALQLVRRRRSRRRPRPRSRASSPRRRARSRVGGRLDARGGVDEVAGDHPLPLGAERDRGLAGQHAGARGQRGAPTSSPAPGPPRRGRAPRGLRARRRPPCAIGVPQTAMTASPMNFSTVPP